MKAKVNYNQTRLDLMLAAKAETERFLSKLNRSIKQHRDSEYCIYQSQLNAEVKRAALDVRIEMSKLQ